MLILLFSVAAAVAIAVRRLHVPYTVAPVLTGLALGILRLFTPPHLTKELLFSVFLPGLLFEAAFHIEFREFWRNRFAIASLAIPGGRSGGVDDRDPDARREHVPSRSKR